jgi:hypothetical protein
VADSDGANYFYIDQGMKALQGSGDKYCSLDPRSCGRLSCEYDSEIRYVSLLLPSPSTQTRVREYGQGLIMWIVIYRRWCNDNEYPITVKCSYLAQYVQAILDRCEYGNANYGLRLVWGQCFDIGGFNVIAGQPAKGQC